MVAESVVRSLRCHRPHFNWESLQRQKRNPAQAHPRRQLQRHRRRRHREEDPSPLLPGQRFLQGESVRHAMTTLTQVRENVQKGKNEKPETDKGTATQRRERADIWAKVPVLYSQSQLHLTGTLPDTKSASCCHEGGAYSVRAGKLVQDSSTRISTWPGCLDQCLPESLTQCLTELCIRP